jgi:molecular chaperone DnaJ
MCGGQGKIRHAQGFFTLERTCSGCHGRGQVIDTPCGTCGGLGRSTRERALSVNIPPGVEDGTRIRLSGEGEAGLRGGAAGDLYIFLSIAAHPFFQRDGADLHCRAPISMTTAALGGEFEVPTIDGGKTRVKIPDGTQSGRRFRLQAKGMPVLRSKQLGDMCRSWWRRRRTSPNGSASFSSNSRNYRRTRPILSPPASSAGSRSSLGPGRGRLDRS